MELQAKRPRHRGARFTDLKKVNMWYEGEDIEWFDALAEKHQVSRQALVHKLSVALRGLEKERPGAVDHLLKVYQ